MKMNHRLITLGLAFGLLGTTCAFAKPSPYFEHRGLSHQEKAVTPHEASGTTGYVHAPSAPAVKDGWPSDMLLG